MDPVSALYVLGLIELAMALMWVRSRVRRILGLGVGKPVFA